MTIDLEHLKKRAADALNGESGYGEDLPWRYILELALEIEALREELENSKAVRHRAPGGTK